MNLVSALFVLLACSLYAVSLDESEFKKALLEKRLCVKASPEDLRLYENINKILSSTTGELEAAGMTSLAFEVYGYLLELDFFCIAADVLSRHTKILSGSRLTSDAIRKALSNSYDLSTLDISTSHEALLRVLGRDHEKLKLLDPKYLTSPQINELLVVLFDTLNKTCFGDAEKETLHLLLDWFKADINYSNGKCLKIACRNDLLGSADIKYLLENTNMDPAIDGSEALHVAAMVDNLSIIEALLEDPRVNPHTQECVVPCKLATRRDQISFDFFINHPRVNRSYVFVHMCGYEKDLTGVIMQTFLIDPDFDPSYQNSAALRQAARRGHSPLVRRLLRHPKIDPTASHFLALRTTITRYHIEPAVKYEDCIEMIIDEILYRKPLLKRLLFVELLLNRVSKSFLKLRFVELFFEPLPEIAGIYPNAMPSSANQAHEEEKFFAAVLLDSHMNMFGSSLRCMIGSNPALYDHFISKQVKDTLQAHPVLLSLNRMKNIKSFIQDMEDRYNPVEQNYHRNWISNKLDSLHVGEEFAASALATGLGGGHTTLAIVTKTRDDPNALKCRFDFKLFNASVGFDACPLQTKLYANSDHFSPYIIWEDLPKDSIEFWLEEVQPNQRHVPNCSAACFVPILPIEKRTRYQRDNECLAVKLWFMFKSELSFEDYMHFKIVFVLHQVKYITENFEELVEKKWKSANPQVWRTIISMPFFEELLMKQLKRPGMGPEKFQELRLLILTFFKARKPNTKDAEMAIDWKRNYCMTSI